MRVRLVAAPVALAAVLLAGCGGGDSSPDPASLAPAGAPIFIEATLAPDEGAAEDIDSLARRIAGIDDLGELIAEELELDALDAGNGFDFAEDVEPWLGERGGLYLDEYDGEDFLAAGAAVETTDSAATRDFIEEFAKTEDGGDPIDRSYEDADYKVDPEDGEAVGVIGDFFAFAETENDFKAMVDASSGDSLAEEEAYSDSHAEAPEDSVADLFVDIGGMIEESGGEIDAEARLFLDSVGLEPEEATAVASLTPTSDHVEIDVSTDVTGEVAAGGDASELLASLPSGSVAAFAAPEFGERFGEAVDRIDAEGLPGEVPPNVLKRTLRKAGVDLDAIASSVGDAAAFVEGETQANLRGALVLAATDATEARNAVSNVGLFLRATGTSGVSPIGGELSGFTVHISDLGPQPLVVAAEGERIAIAYGLAAAKAALAADSGGTLGDGPLYKEAVAALGDVPIAAFADGPPALDIVSSLVPTDDEGFREALPYLRKIEYVAIGSRAAGDRTTARLIVGIGG